MTRKQQAACNGWRDALGRWWAARQGYRIDKGSWLHSTVNRKPVAHGYLNLYRKHHRLIWAALQEAE